MRFYLKTDASLKKGNFTVGEDHIMTNSYNPAKHADYVKEIEDMTVYNYLDVMKILSLELKNKIEKKFYSQISNGILYVGIQELNGPIKIKLVYKFENDKLKDLFKKLLNTEEDIIKVTVGSFENAYNYTVPLQFLGVMMAHENILANGEKTYHKFFITSKNGKVREIIAPHEEIKEQLRKMNGLLQRIYDRKNNKFQVAYKKGKSIKDSAVIHKNNQYMFNIDLKDFYPSCKRELVRRYIEVFFKGTPDKNNNVEMFLDMILYNDALFIGSPVSGVLANVIINKPVAYIKNITDKFGMGYSVYADDMTFSSDRFISEKFINEIFNLGFTKYGLDDYFMIKEEKSHGASKGRRRTTGVTINHENQLTVNRKFYRDLRVRFDKLSKGENVNLNKLRGQIAFATMVDDSGKIYRLLTKYPDIVDKYKLASEKTIKELEKRI